MRLRRKGRLMGRWILSQLSNVEIEHKFGHVSIDKLTLSEDETRIEIYYDDRPIWVPILWRWLIRRKLRHINLNHVNNELKIW